MFDPEASVHRGSWIQGPDGPRELDVEFSGTLAGRHKRVLVECKDYNPASTGKVGIEHVDALDSKAADLRFDLKILCSNAGFTEGAVRKAARKGIGLIAVTKKGDQRNRFVIRTVAYSRNIRIGKITLTIKSKPLPDLADVESKEIQFAGLPVYSWVVARFSQLLANNPIVNGPLTASNNFRYPIEFSVRGKTILVSNLTFTVDFAGCWYVHDVSVDATNGFYDWLRQRIIVPRGANEVELRGIDITRGTLVDAPFETMTTGEDILPGGLDLAVMMVEGLPELGTAPNLSQYVEESDLVLRLDDIPEALRRSNRTLVFRPWPVVADPTLRLTFGSKQT